MIYRIIKSTWVGMKSVSNAVGDYPDRESAELNMGQMQLDDIELIDKNIVSYGIQEINT